MRAVVSPLVSCFPARVKCSEQPRPVYIQQRAERRISMSWGEVGTGLPLKVNGHDPFSCICLSFKWFFGQAGGFCAIY